MCYRVKIPNITRDERIGSVFNELFKIMALTDTCTATDVVWDFNNTSFLHPFFLAPLSIYRQQCTKRIRIENLSYTLSSYLDLIHFENQDELIDINALEKVLDKYATKTYTPILRFKMGAIDMDEAQTLVQRLIERQSNASNAIRQPVSYMLGELICNISQHSQSRDGYIFAQYLHKERRIHICIADCGITIYGSYIKNNCHVEEIGGDEARAMVLANSGASSKNLPDAENRGYGIRSTKKMLVDGIGGDYFMLSGGAFHRYNDKGETFVSLPESISWNGTIVLLRIPIDEPKGFEFYDYVN